MAKKGLSPRISLVWVAFLTMTTATGGILSMLTQQSEFAVLSIGIVIVVLVVGRIFGVAEFELVSRRALGVVGSFLKPVGNRKVRQSIVQLQGDRDWQSVWGHLCEFADVNGLREITLDVNAPWIHESFHATRRLKKDKGELPEEWQSEIPLITDSRVFGRISFTAPVVSEFSHQLIFSNVVEVGTQIEVMVDLIMKGDGTNEERAENESTLPFVDNTLNEDDYGNPSEGTPSASAPGNEP